MTSLQLVDEHFKPPRKRKDLSKEVETLRERIQDLESDLSNMEEEKDIQYDRAEKLDERLTALKDGIPLEEDDEYQVIDKDRLEELEGTETLWEEAWSLSEELKKLKDRYDSGILTEKEDLDKCIELMMELHQK